MLDPLGHDDELAGIQIDVAGSEPHRQATADHQEQFVLMLVVVPVELAGEFRELHEGVIEFARDLRAPVIAAATERLAKIDRKSVVSGKGVSVSIDLGGRRNIKKKNNNITNYNGHTDS